MEQPTYPRAIAVFRAAGAQLVPVPWDREGPSAEALEQVLARHRPKLFYCQPTAHNPTGVTMSPEAARRVLDAAARHHVPVVEDGFDGSLYYGDRRPLPLRALDRNGLVLYIGTFSKVLFPGLRLGWLVAPPPVVERLRAAKQLADLRDEPAHPGRRPPILRATPAGPARRPDRAGVRPPPDGVARSARPAHAGRGELDGAPRRLLAPPHAAGGLRRGGASPAGAPPRAWASRPGRGSSWTGAARAQHGCRSPPCPRGGSTTVSGGLPRRSRTGGGAAAPGRPPTGSRRWWCDLGLRRGVGPDE